MQMIESLFDLPLLITGTAIVFSLCLYALIGQVVVRRYVLTRLKILDADSDFNGAMLQAVMVFYGLAVALIAVSVWQTYADVSKTLSSEATSIAALYRAFGGSELITDVTSAEMIKHASNAFLATKITFINEMADLCEAVGADVQQVSKGIGLDNRIGKKFLHAGPGYGGSCFPKDTLALVRTATDAGSPVRLIETTVAINDARKKAMAARVAKAVGGDLKGKTIGVLGLTFKPNTDDMRDAPSLDIVPALQALGATVQAYDPEGFKEASHMLQGVNFKDGPYDAVDGAAGAGDVPTPEARAAALDDAAGSPWPGAATG